MKELLTAAGRMLRTYGAPATAGALSVSSHSAWPAVTLLVAVAGRVVHDAVTPALREVLMTIAREVGPVLGRELSAEVRRWGRRRTARHARRNGEATASAQGRIGTAEGAGDVDG